MRFEITDYDRESPARVATLTTSRGPVETPAFMPVGTQGAVKTLTGEEVWLTGARLMVASALHLMLRPGPDVVAELGGVHGLSGFEGPMLTDSGGFPSRSQSRAGAAPPGAAPEADDDGMVFRSMYDGRVVHLSPEEAMTIQARLGADIATTLDDCPAVGAGRARLELAVGRTNRWARRCKEAHPGGDQALFGVVHGGTDRALRRQSAIDMVALGFDGYALGGLVRESLEDRTQTLLDLEPALPLDSPRYLMGVGDPIGILAAVRAGIDLFASVWPTRLARHGYALTPTGRQRLEAAVNAGSSDPLDPECTCEACRVLSKGALRHLFTVHEPLGARLLTVHNLTFLGRFMARLRAAVRDGSLSELAAAWEMRGGPASV